MGDDPGWVKRVWNVLCPMQAVCSKARCWRFVSYGSWCLKHQEVGIE